MVKLSAAQERNYREAFATTRSWASAHGKDPVPLLDRVAMVLLTESRGQNLANDGLAYADNAEQVRPGWVVEEDGSPMTLTKRAAIRRVLRKSLDMPNDGVGNNGGSTGGIQQLSQEFVAVRFPGKTWGYGSIAATMDVGNAVSMFLGRLVVTDNPVYAGITFSDPLVADVLRVQQPLISEHESSNYNASQVATAKAIVAQLTDTKDGFDVASLDDLTNIVADQVGAMEKRIMQRLDAMPTAVWTKGITSNDPGGHANEMLLAILIASSAAAAGVNADDSELADLRQKLIDVWRQDGDTQAAVVAILDKLGITPPAEGPAE